MKTQYQYQQIPREGYIRVLVLYPATALDAPMHGHLLQAPLEKSSSYAALSYSWGMNKDGDAALNRTIKISGKRLEITQNLFEGLRRIRDSTQSRYLWIDAICINQDDISERNDQVAQMASVYSCSNRLIVWLGEGESEEQDRAILDMASFNKEGECKYGEISDYSHVISNPYFIDAGGEAVNLPAVLYVFKASESPDNQDIAIDKVDPAMVRNIESLIELAVQFFQRRYWRRRWIIQELYHSRGCSLEIRWGPCVYQDLWHLFSGSLANVLAHVSFLKDSRNRYLTSIHDVYTERVNETLKNSHAINRMEELMFQGPNLSIKHFIHAMASFGFMDCFDERDRLFALSSLSPDNIMAPDYSMTMSQVCIRFAKDFLRIQEDGLINLLNCLRSHEQCELRRTQGVQLPSWVPDLRDTRIMLWTRRDDVQVRTEVSNEAAIITFDAHYFGVVEMSTASQNSGSGEKSVDYPSVKSEDEYGTIHLCPFPDMYCNMESPQAGDLVCMLVAPGIDSIYKLNISTWSGIGIETLVLRKQMQTYHDEAVYQLISCFEWQIYRPSELGADLGAKIRVCVA